MDLMLGEHDGLALIKDLTALAPAMRILVFSLHAEDVYAERCLRAGAHGYVMKTEPVPMLFRAVRDVATGGIAVSPRVSAAMLGSLGGRGRQASGGEAQLTDRELQVYRTTRVHRRGYRAWFAARQNSATLHLVHPAGFG